MDFIAISDLGTPHILVGDANGLRLVFAEDRKNVIESNYHVYTEEEVNRYFSATGMEWFKNNFNSTRIYTEETIDHATRAIKRGLELTMLNSEW
jgi:hypothetical protein